MRKTSAAKPAVDSNGYTQADHDAVSMDRALQENKAERDTLSGKTRMELYTDAGLVD